MIAEFKQWFDRQDPMMLGQAYLVLLTAAGVADFGQVIFAYAVEIIVMNAVSMLLFSPTWGLALRRLFDLFVQGAFALLLATIIFAFFHGIKNDTHIDKSLTGLGKPLLIAAIYCAMHFSLVLRGIWHDADRTRQWVRLVVAPGWSVWFVILIALFAGQAAFEFIDQGSVATHRIVSTVLMTVAASMRVAFARSLRPTNWNDTNRSYRDFMYLKTLD